MILVRRYTPADLERVLPQARAFHDESPVHRHHPFDPGKVAELLAGAQWQPDWLAVVAEDEAGELTGFALVTVQQPYYSSTTLQLLDLAIYVVPTRRGLRTFPALMSHILDWGAGLGAVEAAIGLNTGINDKAALSAFAKLGFSVSGWQVTKPL